MPIEEDIVIGEIPKNNREDIRVTLSNFKGHDLVGARIWFKSKDGEPRPSSKGITVNVKVLPELIGLLEQAEKKAVELGVLGEDDAQPPPPDDEPPF